MKSTINGLLSRLAVLRTRTAFPIGKLDVVVVIVVGTEVGGRQSKSLQGHPAEQHAGQGSMVDLYGQ